MQETRFAGHRLHCELAAYHEAAHAVVALHYGRVVKGGYMRRFAPVALMVIPLFAPISAQAARFYESEIAGNIGYNLYIEGQIARGDYNQLTTIIKRRQAFPHGVRIGSSGGDVSEAMAIGRLFRKSLVDVYPSNRNAHLVSERNKSSGTSSNIIPSDGQCNSACALIVFASVAFGVEDDMRVGIHRPIYDPEYFAGLSFADAQEKTRQLDREVRAYLKEMDVPTDIADKMMSIPSNDVVYLKIRDYRERIGGQPSAIFEWLKARCGAPEPQEQQDISNTLAYRWYTDLTNAGATIAAAEYREGAQLGARLSSGYRDYLYNKYKALSSCREKAVEEERRRILQTMK